MVKDCMPKIGNTLSTFFSPLLFNLVLEVLVSEIRQEKEMAYRLEVKKENCLFSLKIYC